MPRHVIVDGSNIATEGRSMPSLKQLNEAVLAFMEEYPEDTVTVVVDATFGHRIDAKEELINGLIGARLTLAEVVAQFMVLNEGYEHELAVIRRIYPGATDEEKMLWNVVDYSQQRINPLPVWQRIGVIARLQAEILALSAEFAAVHAN